MATYSSPTIEPHNISYLFKHFIQINMDKELEKLLEEFRDAVFNSDIWGADEVNLNASGKKFIKESYLLGLYQALKAKPKRGLEYSPGDLFYNNGIDDYSRNIQDLIDKQDK